MRLSTRKIIGITAITLFGTAMTLFVTVGVLRSYLQIIVLIIAIVASIILLGWAKPRGNNKLVAILIILAALVFQAIIFLLLGLKLGWVQNIYRWDFTNLTQVFLPVVLAIVGEEILRGQLIERGKGSKLAVLLTGVTLWLIEIILVLPNYSLNEPQAIFALFSVVVGPAALKNILLTYIAYAYDYRIGLAYRLIMDLPIYLLPVIPDAGIFLSALFQIGFMFILALALVNMDHVKLFAQSSLTRGLKKPKKLETEQTRRIKRGLKWVGISAATVVIVGYVALMSGLFRYHFLAIGSGSMEPNISRGDLVLVEKSKDYDKMKEGDILVYHHSNVVMVHRIANVIEDNGIYTFQTKGDANGGLDTWQVEQSDIIGVARGKIAMFGYPTLWLNELFNGGEI